MLHRSKINGGYRAEFPPGAPLKVGVSARKAATG
jgi:hypothetical protein